MIEDGAAADLASPVRPEDLGFRPVSNLPSDSAVDNTTPTNGASPTERNGVVQPYETLNTGDIIQ